ncbi:MAG TPA: YlxR family protein [Streptosporangiaceae bacterium]|nr:YlxR family protein [Streptosporangiaceae bacterium]
MTVRTGRHSAGMPVMRTCVGCKERAVKSSLLRIVAVGDVIQPDPQARLPGRGAYLHPSLACFELARRRRAFPRALRAAGPLSLASLAEYLCGAESTA